jgi:hypothetical protein
MFTASNFYLYHVTTILDLEHVRAVGSGTLLQSRESLQRESSLTRPSDSQRHSLQYLISTIIVYETCLLDH